MLTSNLTQENETQICTQRILQRVTFICVKPSGASEVDLQATFQVNNHRMTNVRIWFNIFRREWKILLPFACKSPLKHSERHQ